MSKNIKEIQIDKQLESMSKSLKQLSSNMYGEQFTLSRSIFTLSSFVHKMLVVYNQNNDDEQTIISNELSVAYDNIKNLVGGPTR